MLRKVLRLPSVTLAFVLLAACNEDGRIGREERETKILELDKSELTRVEIRMGAGELTVRKGSTNFLDAAFDYQRPSWKPTVNYRSTGVRSDLEILQPSDTGGFGNTEYKWDLQLNEGILMDLVAKLGAGEAKMNLGDLTLRSVEMNMGAGEVNMDLRGKIPARSYDVHINGGVGQANVYLPRDVGIYATAQGGIGEIHVSGLEQRGNHWVNASKLDSPITIRVDVKGGIGEIRLVAE